MLLMPAPVLLAVALGAPLIASIIARGGTDHLRERQLVEQLLTALAAAAAMVPAGVPVSAEEVLLNLAVSAGATGFGSLLWRSLRVSAFLHQVFPSGVDLGRVSRWLATVLGEGSGDQSPRP